MKAIKRALGWYRLRRFWRNISPKSDSPFRY